MPGTLTKARLFALVQHLARARNGPVPTADIIAAVREAPWASPYRYQQIYTALIRCRQHGVLFSCVVRNEQRGRGHRPAGHHWWPVVMGPHHATEATGSVVPGMAYLIDQVIAGLPVGTVIRLGWAVRQIGNVVTACTTESVVDALQHRTASQRPRLVACPADTEWEGWWRVAEADSVRTRPNRRDASAALIARVRAEQTRTGRHSVAVRALATGLGGARRAAFVARVRLACRAPVDPSVLIMRTPRLIALGRVQYTSYVVPLGEESVGRAELDVDAWWFATMLLERRHASEARAHVLPGDEATARGRCAPYAEVLRELHAALKTLSTSTGGQHSQDQALLTAPAATWLRRSSWGMSIEDAVAADRVPETEWISVPAFYQAMRRLVAAHRVPSIRSLRLQLASAGVWMRPASLIHGLPSVRSHRHRPLPAVTLVEAVDAYFWLQCHYVGGRERVPHRWAWRWLGLCRDWDRVLSVAASPTHPCARLAETALRVRVAVERGCLTG